jgi:hypothetical protein
MERRIRILIYLCLIILRLPGAALLLRVARIEWLRQHQQHHADVFLNLFNPTHFGANFQDACGDGNGKMDVRNADGWPATRHRGDEARDIHDYLCHFGNYHV